MSYALPIALTGLLEYISIVAIYVDGTRSRGFTLPETSMFIEFSSRAEFIISFSS